MLLWGLCGCPASLGTAPPLTGGHFRSECDVQIFLIIRSPMAGAAGKTLQLGRAEEGTLRPSFLGLFRRTGNALFCLPLSKRQGQLPQPYNMFRHEGGTGSWSLVSAAKGAAARSLCRGCLRAAYASSFWSCWSGNCRALTA